ncbi:MAG: extracellular solute-binding protein [Fusobacteriaceae bacterium]
MKKILTLLSLSFLLFACGKDGANSKKGDNKLFVYVWAEFIPREIYEKFQEETGIKVIEDIYSSNEEMFAKLKAGATGYDIVMPSTDYLEIMSSEGMIQNIDKSKISTLENIDPIVFEKTRYFDPNGEKGVPYAMGGTGIIVNKKYVKDYPRDFSIYLKDNLKGKMTLLDDMREVMTSALLTLGYEQDTTNEAEIKAAAELVKQWKKNIVKFDAESFGKGFAAGEFLVVHGYSDNVFGELSEEAAKEVDFIIPEKGGVSYIDSLAITSTSKNVDNAHKFIEFIHRPENYALLADELGIPSINVPARELMESKPVYEIKDLKNTEILRDIKNALPIQGKYWQEIMVSE